MEGREGSKIIEREIQGSVCLKLKNKDKKLTGDSNLAEQGTLFLTDKLRG